MKFSYTVSEAEAGIRLDLYLVPKLKTQSRASIQHLIQRAKILLNGRLSKSSHKIQTGDLIDVDLEEKDFDDVRLEPWDYRLSVLYEDQWLMAVEKPAHMVVHPGAGRSTHTLVHALLKILPEIKSVGHPLRPGIVHRLDKETSGVLLIAKTQETYHALSTMFKERRIEKYYRAAAYGVFREKQGRIDKPLGRDLKDRKRISVRAKKSRNAVTLYRVLRDYDFGSLLDVQILTGRTHQIRVHLASESHPIIGDSKYGGGNWNRIPDLQLRDSLHKIHFFGLHAFSLDFSHPSTGAPLHIEAPLPSSWNLLK